MDFDETTAALDSIVGTYVIVYAGPSETSVVAEATSFGSGALSARGIFKRDEDDGAADRRRFSEAGGYEAFPELDLGSAPLELYERQATGYTFEGMCTPDAGAGFILWRELFVASEWVYPGRRPDWLWIRARPLGLVVSAEFPDAPAAP